jgi:predicted kinase
VQPIEDIHQRALARAVLPEEGVDLTGLDHQVDRVVGNERAEALGDTSQFKLQRDLQRRFEQSRSNEDLRGSTMVLPLRVLYRLQRVTSAGWAR